MMITRTTVSCFHRETEFIRPLQRTKMFTSKRTLIALGPRRLGSDRENSGWFFFFLHCDYVAKDTDLCRRRMNFITA